MTLLAAGAVLRLPQQYWRFVGLRDLLAVAGAAVGGALLFWLGGQILGGWQPANAAFPLIHALLLGALLIGARVLALVQATRHAGEAAADAQAVLLVGAADGTDLFIRALERDRRAPYRVIGILSLRARQAGRRAALARFSWAGEAARLVALYGRLTGFMMRPMAGVK